MAWEALTYANRLIIHIIPTVKLTIGTHLLEYLGSLDVAMS